MRVSSSSAPSAVHAASPEKKAASGNKPKFTPPAAKTTTAVAPAATPGVSPSSGSTTNAVQSSLDQGQDQNIQFLELQSQINTQSETFTTLSNVMKTENDTLKNTAGNMAM